jgi:hypothetical protein
VDDVNLQLVWLPCPGTNKIPKHSGVGYLLSQQASFLQGYRHAGKFLFSFFFWAFELGKVCFFVVRVAQLGSYKQPYRHYNLTLLAEASDAGLYFPRPAGWLWKGEERVVMIGGGRRRRRRRKPGQGQRKR